MEVGGECGLPGFVVRDSTDVKQFSDEFNMPGRTFYEDDDPFFEAVDLWYGVTMDKEVSSHVLRSRVVPGLT